MRICDIREKFFIVRPIMILYCCLAYISFTECFSFSLSLSAFRKRSLYSENRNYHLLISFSVSFSLIYAMYLIHMSSFCQNAKRNGKISMKGRWTYVQFMNFSKLWSHNFTFQTTNLRHVLPLIRYLYNSEQNIKRKNNDAVIMTMKMITSTMKLIRWYCEEDIK